MLDKFNEVEHYFTSKPRSKIEFRLIHAYPHGRRFQFLTSTGIFSKKRIDLGTRVLIEHMVLPKDMTPSLSHRSWGLYPKCY